MSLNRTSNLVVCGSNVDGRMFGLDELTFLPVKRQIARKPGSSESLGCDKSKHGGNIALALKISQLQCRGWENYSLCNILSLQQNSGQSGYMDPVVCLLLK